jgi:hypothetical protein
MLLSDVMDAVGTALQQVDGLRVFPYWADRVTPPFAIVEFPDRIDYDATMVRGGDRLTLKVMVGVARTDARTARDALAVYADGSGAASVKAAIEAYSATAYGSARVESADFGMVTVAATEYLAATFTLDIIGTGIGA